MLPSHESTKDPFTCASYNPFESLHIDHISPLSVDDKSNSHILVMIDTFSRWVELFSTKTTGASEAAGCIFQHFGRFGTPDVIHTYQGPAFRNELFSELSRLSKEENGLVEHANQEIMRHLRAMLFDARVHDKWSYEQLPMVQRIMNTVEKISTGGTPAELILSNSIRLSNRILAPGSSNPTSRIALSDTMDNWVARQHTLLQVAQAHQHQSDSHLYVEYDPCIMEYPIHSYVLFTTPVGRGNKLLPKHRGPFL
jgi:hypothetical protein